MGMAGDDDLELDGGRVEVEFCEIVKDIQEHTRDLDDLVLAQSARPVALVVVPAHGDDGRDLAKTFENARFADIPGVDDQVGIAQRGARLCSEQAVGVRDDPDRCLAVGHHLRQRRGA